MQLFSIFVKAMADSKLTPELFPDLSPGKLKFAAAISVSLIFASIPDSE